MQEILKWSNSQRQKVEWCFPGVEVGRMGSFTLIGTVSVEEMKTFWRWMMMTVTQVNVLNVTVLYT